MTWMLVPHLGAGSRTGLVPQEAAVLWGGGCSTSFRRLEGGVCTAPAVRTRRGGWRE